MKKPTKQVNVVTKILEEHKASDIQVIDVSKKSPFADFYVLATASNIRHLDALAEAVIDELIKNKYNVNHKEGKPESGWILVDAFDVIVNIFSESERVRIRLEDVLNRE